MGVTTLPLHVHDVLDERPQESLLAIRDILLAGGQRGGYSLDSMAVGTFVQVAERVLADHRGVLRNPECLTALREICDVFVEAGWPQAHQLVFGLEQIFR